jgi:hypothetical protein
LRPIVPLEGESKSRLPKKKHSMSSDGEPYPLYEPASMLDASFVLTTSAICEESLAGLIRINMRPLSETLKARLFTAYGPLGSFSAKIDIALGFSLITPNHAKDLHIIRRIRNEFAHSISAIHFDSPQVERLFKRFAQWHQGCDLRDLWSIKTRQWLIFVTSMMNAARDAHSPSYNK